MKFYKIIVALLEGVLYAIFMWLGDKYLLDNDNAFMSMLLKRYFLP